MTYLPRTSHADPPRPTVAMLISDGITLLDVIGPHTALIGHADVHLVAATLNPIVSDTGLVIHPTATFEEMTSTIDVLFVPGGPATIHMMADERVLSFLRDRAPEARYVTAVCTGTLVLGAAGLIRGRRATAHWAVRDLLPVFGARPVQDRVVLDGKLITGGGVTAGIDFGLTLLAELVNTQAAEFAQLAMEYDPRPPFNSGSPLTAEPSLVAAATSFTAPLIDAIKTGRVAIALREDGEQDSPTGP